MRLCVIAHSRVNALNAFNQLTAGTQKDSYDFSHAFPGEAALPGSFTAMVATVPIKSKKAAYGELLMV